ncbi:MAG: menaquinone reductase multiheme cytochrome c subunit QrcA [Desulfohalobiaceae bacterium]
MANNKLGGPIPFLLGLAAALVLGWGIYPHIIYSQQEQPVQFSHQVHKDQGLDCESCHSYRSDGSYAGVPSLEDCTMCHYDVLSGLPHEEKFVEDYVQQEKEVPWKVYQKQPDNVYFSHIAHQDFECNECHLDLEDAENLPPLSQNRLTGYNQETMKMKECESCHADHQASNACYVCHK